MFVELYHAAADIERQNVTLAEGLEVKVLGDGSVADAVVGRLHKDDKSFVAFITPNTEKPHQD